MSPPAYPTSLTLANAHLRLALSLNEGNIAPGRLEAAEGSVWADEPASILIDVRASDGAVLRAKALRYISHSATDTELVIETTAVFAAASANHTLRVILRYTLAADAPVLTEQIELISSTPLVLHRAALTWRLRTRTGLSWLPVPFGEGHGTAAPVLLTDSAASKIINRDGAVIHDAARNRALLVAKTPSDRDPEYVVVETKGAVLGYSGFRPEQACNDCPRWLASGRYLSSPTRFEIVTGPIERAFTAHRAFMDAHGLGLPSDYAPPFNYCIYYECKNQWERTQAAALIPVAASLGCTLLYTDQGWETGFGSGVWDEVRLGKCADFVAEAARVGLDVGVLVSLHASPDGATAWTPECFRRTPEGTVEDGDRWHPHGLCAGSPRWREEKTHRLARVAAAGVKFFSFDFNDAKDYAGFGFRRYPCHAQGHDHAGPQTEWQHVAAVARQQREFRETCPAALVEAHDWVLAGDASLPGYLFPASAQERWGFEYMWNPFADLKAGRLQNLVWFNLAYSRPLYLHLDLANDHPEHLTAFWFLASTIRHLGIGNFTTLDPARQDRVHAACALYLARREYFTHGVFFASGPRVHVHGLPGRGAIVMFFNDTDAPLDVSAAFAPADLGLANAAVIRSETWLGPSVAVRDRTFTVTLSAWAVAGVRVG